jgi:hypothetical protein
VRGIGDREHAFVGEDDGRGGRGGLERDIAVRRAKTGQANGHRGWNDDKCLTGG